MQMKSEEIGECSDQKKITQFVRLQNNYLKQSVIESPNRNTRIVDNNRLSRDLNRKEGKQNIPLTMNQNPKVLIHRRRKNLIRTTRAIKTVKSYILKYYDEYRLIEMHLIGDYQIKWDLFYSISAAEKNFVVFSQSFKNVYVWLSKSFKNLNLRLLSNHQQDIEILYIGTL